MPPNPVKFKAIDPIQFHPHPNSKPFWIGAQAQIAIAERTAQDPDSRGLAKFVVRDGQGSERMIFGGGVVDGEWRDGLPPNPNGWMKVTDAKGRTGPMPVPDIEPFLLSVKAQNHKEWRGAPVWRSLVDGQVKKLQMQRK